MHLKPFTHIPLQTQNLDATFDIRGILRTLSNLYDGTNFAKSSIVIVWQGTECKSEHSLKKCFDSFKETFKISEALTTDLEKKLV